MSWLEPETQGPNANEEPYRGLPWIFSGAQGLRAGWSVLLFFFLAGVPNHEGLFSLIVVSVFTALHLLGPHFAFNPEFTFFSELAGFLSMAAAAAVIAAIEGRRLRDFYLTEAHMATPRCISHFLGGLAAGFAAVSVLVGALALGGWMHFGPIALSGAALFKVGALWAASFLLVGLYEEGTFRCYLQSTLTRGLNFWWALGSIALICADLLRKPAADGVWGVYAAALLGLFPCLILHLRKAPRSGFWQAAWVTSTFFGFLHTANGGEDPTGILGAALIGFIFCVSIRLTGSAWWAIGCHVAWDWAETFFYGAIDSGNVATSHFLTTAPAGNPLFSGGTDGPEGSILLLAVLALLLAALLLFYGRRKPDQRTPPAK